jgi:hypothetical protein
LTKSDILFVCGANQTVWVAQALQTADSDTQDTIEIEWMQVKIKREDVTYSPCPSSPKTQIWWDSIVGCISDSCCDGKFPKRVLTSANAFLEKKPQTEDSGAQEMLARMQQTVIHNLSLCEEGKQLVSLILSASLSKWSHGNSLSDFERTTHNIFDFIQSLSKFVPV